jgi:undecaprenyl-diphosphatase
MTMADARTTMIDQGALEPTEFGPEALAESTWELLRQADEELLVWVLHLRRAWLSPLMAALTRLGNASTWTVLGLLLLAVPDTRPLAWSVAWAAGLATVLVQIGKYTCRRDRPNLAARGFAAMARHPDRYSFPSGHTAAAVAVAAAWCAAPGLIGPLALVLASGIALSRLYVGAHYPLDVAAGAALGALVGGFVGAGLF